MAMYLLFSMSGQNRVSWRKQAGRCRQGLCGARATRVVSGTVQMDVEVGLTAEQKNAGYVLPCVSRAKGTVVVAA
jgi:ferredoxin